MGNSYTSKKPCSVWLVKGVGETPSTDCITDILDGEGIKVSGTKTVKVISLLPPRDGHIGGVKRKDVPENAVEIDPDTGEIFVARSGVNFPITIEQGGTGKTNREDALLALLPDTLDQEGKVLSVYKKEDGTTSVKWIDMPNVGDYAQGDGINISEIDPDTGKRTISTKVNASEFRYNDNGVIELSDQVTNALVKAGSSVQTVNNTPPDANGNVNVAGSLPVLTLMSDFVGDISVLRDWLLAQPNQRSTLYIKTQKLPNIQVIVTATGFTQTWETLANYIKTQVRALYDGCPNFTCIYNIDGELELSTNDILNPIEMYMPIVPDNESLNVQMKLVPPGAVIVSQPYATIQQVNTIVNNAVIPLQQDIKLLNLDMFFADYYIGISINYLLSGKWETDEVQTYNDILTQLQDTNKLTFTLSDGIGQFDYPLTITKQDFIGYANLDNFMSAINDKMDSEHNISDFYVIFQKSGTQGFMATNTNSNKGILVCKQEDNNLAVIMKLTDDTGAVGRIYTEFSQNSLQQQIIDNKLIIDDVFINKIKNGENVTIDVDSENNTATFNATSPAPAPIVGGGIPTYNFDGAYLTSFNTAVIPAVTITAIKKPFPTKKIVISIPKVLPSKNDANKILPVATCLGVNTLDAPLAVSILTSGDLTYDQVKSGLDSSGTTSFGVYYYLKTTQSTQGSNVSIINSQFSDMNWLAAKIESTIRNGALSMLFGITVQWVIKSGDIGNLVININNTAALVRFSMGAPNGDPFNIVLKLTQYDASYNPTGATLSNAMPVGASMINITRCDYTVATPESSITVDNEWLTFIFDPRTIIANPALMNTNQALITFTSDKYSDGVALQSLPNREVANYAPISAGGVEWVYSNQLGEFGILLAVQQQYVYYDDRDLNAGGGSANLVIFNVLMIINQFLGDTWSTEIAFIGQMATAKAHTVRVIITAQDNSGIPSPYTVMGQKVYQVDINVPASGTYPNIPASQNNPVIKLDCNNNAIMVIQSDNNTNGLTLSQELGLQSGKTEGQSNFALGMDAAITSFKITPKIGNVFGVTTKLQNINGRDYFTFILQEGKVYNLILGGIVALSNYLNTQDTPVYVGLVNIEQFRPDYWETYWEQVEFDARTLKGEINSSQNIVTIDMTNETAPKTFRLFFGTQSAVSGIRGIISDYITINFKDETDGI